MQIPQCFLRQPGIRPYRSVLQGESALLPHKHVSSPKDMHPPLTQASICCRGTPHLTCRPCSKLMCAHRHAGVPGLSGNAPVHRHWEERLHCPESVPDAGIHRHKGCIPEPHRCVSRASNIQHEHCLLICPVLGDLSQICRSSCLQSLACVIASDVWWPCRCSARGHRHCGEG